MVGKGHLLGVSVWVVGVASDVRGLKGALLVCNSDVGIALRFGILEVDIDKVRFAFAFRGLKGALLVCNSRLETR